MLKKQIAELSSNGYLKKNLTVEQEDYLIHRIPLVSRFWISECRISYQNETPQKMIGHYLKILGNILYRESTPMGKKDIDGFLKKL